MLGCKGLKQEYFSKLYKNVGWLNLVYLLVFFFPLGYFFPFYYTTETAQCIVFRTGVIFFTS